MIAGIGIDLVELERLSRIYNKFGHRFLNRILTAAEISSLPANALIPFLAGRFAAKEAAVKAFGTGFTQGVTPHDIEVGMDANGRPVLRFMARALEQTARLGVTIAHVSITHERSMAAAVVILERS